VSAPPTFSVYRLYAELVETEVVDVPRDPETFAVDVDALVEAARSANLVVVTSPNNPTGDLFPLEATRRLCEACPGIVLVDEAYVEFSREGASAKALLPECGNLVVLHTLSKAFCLAGARIGYLVGPSSVMAALAAVRQPYSVNVLSQIAAETVLKQLPRVQELVAEIVEQRAFLSEELSKFDELTVWPSAANFLLVRVPHAHRVWETLRDEHSILVRDFSSTPGLEGCLRITVGRPEENVAVVEAFMDILALAEDWEDE
jgi:histidinol-phosphate aminotransferase